MGSLDHSFQISTFLGSGVTPGFSRASSKESKRMLVVPGRSLDIMNIHKIHQGSYVSIICTFLQSGLTPGFSRASSKESKRTLEVPERSLGGF